MSTNEPSVLARKITAGQSKPESFPALKEFAEAAAKSAAPTIGELLQSEAEVEISKNGMTLFSDAALDSADPGVYYWIVDGAGEDAALISISPALSVLTMERLLGGELLAPSENAASSMLDFRMSESLVDVVTAALNGLLQERLETDVRIRPGDRRGARSFREALGGDDNAGPAFQIAVDLHFGEHKAADALGLYFPLRFVERLGLMRRRKPSAAASKNSFWAAQMRRNILNCELPLPVILDRYTTSVGELSRLKVGQVVGLNPNALRALEVTAMTDAGPSNIARGRLGAYKQRKAVKLTTDINKDFIGGI